MIGHKKHKRLKKEGEGELAFAKGTEEEGALGRANQELGIGMEKGTEAQRHKGGSALRGENGATRPL